MWKRLTKAPLVVSLAGTALALCGCAHIHNGLSTLKGSPPAAAEVTSESVPTPAMKTVRPRSKTVRLDDEVEADQPAVRVAGTPPLAQIFSFRAAGATMDHWRPPFVIAENDGPLTAYVRNSARELRDFKAGLKTREAQGGGVKPCGEAQVAAKAPGCLSGSRIARTAAASGDPRKQ